MNSSKFSSSALLTKYKKKSSAGTVKNTLHKQNHHLKKKKKAILEKMTTSDLPKWKKKKLSTSNFIHYLPKNATFMCLRESTSPMTANLFLYACILASSSSVATCSSSGFLYVATYRNEKHKSNHIQRMCSVIQGVSNQYLTRQLQILITVVKLNKQNATTDTDTRPYHLTALPQALVKSWRKSLQINRRSNCWSTNPVNMACWAHLPSSLGHLLPSGRKGRTSHGYTS